MSNKNNEELRLSLIEATHRIKSIKWKIEGRSREKLDWCVERLEEFIYRSALWKDNLEDYGPREYLPFLNIPSYVNPFIRIDKDIWEDVHQYLSSSKIGPLTQMTCECYLHWVALKVSGSLDKFDLPAPYEPLIEMYEGGSGPIYQEQNYICVQTAMVPFKRSLK